MQFKIGDRVRVYDRGSVFVGTVKQLGRDEKMRGNFSAIYVEFDQYDHIIGYGEGALFLTKQCRKLKPKSVTQKTKDMTFWEAIEFLKNVKGKYVTCYGNNTRYFIEIELSTSGCTYLILKVRLANDEIYEWRPTSKEILDMKYWVVK